MINTFINIINQLFLYIIVDYFFSFLLLILLLLEMKDSRKYKKEIESCYVALLEQQRKINELEK